MYLDMTFNEALDKILENDVFLEAAADKDLAAYFDILRGKGDSDFKLDDVQYEDRVKFFITTIQEFVTSQNVEKLKVTLGSVYYTYLAGLYNLDTITLDNSFKYDEPDDLNVPVETAELGHIKNVVMDDYHHYEGVLNYAVCDNLFIKNMEDAAPRVTGTTRKWQSITIDTKLERIRLNATQKVIYTENALYPDSHNILLMTFPILEADENGIEEIYLPNVPNIQIPKWLCVSYPNVTIYKTKGQKVSIYSNYRDWCKEHIKSI